jgi:hypothetical protein
MRLLVLMISSITGVIAKPSHPSRRSPGHPTDDQRYPETINAQSPGNPISNIGHSHGNQRAITFTQPEEDEGASQEPKADEADLLTL